MVFFTALALIAVVSCASAPDVEPLPEVSGIERAQEDSLGKIERFVFALDLLEEGDSRRAKPLLASLAFDEGFPLQTYAAWRLALIEHEADNPEGVLGVLNQDFSCEPGPLEADFLFLRAWAYLETGRPSAALEIYEKLRSAWPDLRVGLRKFRCAQALIALDRKREAAALLWDVELLHYGSMWADDASALRAELEGEGVVVGPRSKVVVQAMELRTDNRDWNSLYDLASWYLKRCKGADCSKAKYYRARALEGMGDWRRARGIYLDLGGGKTYGNLALWRLFLRAANEGLLDLARERADLLKSRYPWSELASRAFASLASEYHARGNYGRELLFIRAALGCRNVWRRDELLWRAGWAYYRQHNLERAKLNWEWALKYAKKSDRVARINFWLWRVSKDSRYLARIPTSNPPSYYLLLARALMGTERREISVSEVTDEHGLESVSFDRAMKDAAVAIDSRRHRVWMALADAGLFDLLRAELSWVEGAIEDSAARMSLARAYYSAGGYYEAAMTSGPLFWSNAAPSREVWELQFPRAYMDTVERFAKRYDLDPLFVLAAMRQESMFDADALSFAGARGLMQIIPSTGKQLYYQLGRRGFDVNMLYDPEVSIELGCFYLSRMRRDGRGLVGALCAYNAGPHRLKRWRQRFRGLSCFEAIEEIPFRETKTYVQRVWRNWEIYRQLYGKAKDSIFKDLEGECL